MIITTLRDNARYKPLRDPIAVITAVAALTSSLKSIFGGGEDDGHWEAGRFIPGDLNNRLEFLAQRMSRFGLTTSDIDRDVVDTFIYQPSGWQGNIDNYVAEVYQDKKNNPQKYSFNNTPSGMPANLNTSGFDMSNLSTLLMYGIAAGLIYSLVSGKKRR